MSHGFGAFSLTIPCSNHCNATCGGCGPFPLQFLPKSMNNDAWWLLGTSIFNSRVRVCIMVFNAFNCECFMLFSYRFKLFSLLCMSRAVVLLCWLLFLCCGLQYVFEIWLWYVCCCSYIFVVLLLCFWMLFVWVVMYCVLFFCCVLNVYIFVYLCVFVVFWLCVLMIFYVLSGWFCSVLYVICCCILYFVYEIGTLFMFVCWKCYVFYVFVCM